MKFSIQKPQRIHFEIRRLFGLSGSKIPVLFLFIQCRKETIFSVGLSGLIIILHITDINTNHEEILPAPTYPCTPIEQVEAPVKTKSHLAALAAALQYIYVQPEWNQRIFELLSSKLIEGKKKTGREGMSLWEVFVLAQVRLCMNISYDELHHISNYDTLDIMGVLPTDLLCGQTV